MWHLGWIAPVCVAMDEIKGFGMAFNAAANKGFNLDLAGHWTLSALGSDDTLAMHVPGDVHSALFDAGRIPDPYFGRNEYALRDIADKDWVLTRQFEVPEVQLAGSWYLDIDNIDTVASVYINDTLVLEAANCFRRYRPSISQALKAGSNTIRVVIHSSVNEAARLQAEQPFPVPYVEHNCPIANGNLLRKPQCHYGWDWNIALAPLGLYGTVAVRRMAAARIEHVLAKQKHLDDGSVDLIVTVGMHADEAGITSLHIGLNGESERLDCGVNPGLTEVSHVIHVESPELWWPNGSGDQALSELVVETPEEKLTKLIGFRKLELVTDPDEVGARFAFRVNGREIFCKGANWIPADALFSRTSPAKTEALLQSAVDANMNMVRVWGGGFYEADWFYDMCDRLGLMVWQDFMFACNIYPSTKAFLEEVKAEVDYQVKRLSSHASIVVWCGDNELIGALSWFEVTRANRDRYLVSYDRLNRTIETGMKAVDADLTWWPSSPSPGILDFGDAWHADTSGDMHYWSVWHENKDFSDYRSVKPRFCSEFGFQSYTSMSVIETFADEADMNIASPVMESHQKNVGGNERIAGTMFRYFRFPKDFANFVYLSQVQQGLAIKTAVDYWRSLKPRCMGTVYWQLNDTWPVASWASLDYGGGWKALHYMARRFFQPVDVAVIPDDVTGSVSISAVNDTSDEVSVKVESWLVSLDGTREPLGIFEGVCQPDRACILGELSGDTLPEDKILFWQFTASNGMTGAGHHVKSTYKVLDLVPSKLAYSLSENAQGGWNIEVSTEALALYVVIETNQPGRFSDNAFDLCRGESRVITFIPENAGGDVPEFKLFDLHSCYAQ